MAGITIVFLITFYIMNESKEIKGFYTQYSDEIIKKRFESADPIRRYAHRAEYESIVRLVPTGSSVIDAGCGEGIVSFLLAEKGIASSGADISFSNIEAAKHLAEQKGFGQLIEFVQGDAEHLPYADKSVDVAISTHVLEHLPDFDQGARELTRVAKKRIIVALPTCLNFASAALLGWDWGFWRFTKRTIFSFPLGIIRIIINIFGEGVQEGYAGKQELPHIFRYPWVMRRRLERATGWKIVRFEASSLVMPYFQFLLPIARKLEPYRQWMIFQWFGYGSIAVLEPLELQEKK